MRTFTLTLALSFAFILGHSQNLPKNSKGHIEYQKVIESGNQLPELHKSALKWIASNYNSLPDVLKLELEDQMVIRGSFPIINGGYKCRLIHTITIDFKDYKARVTIGDFVFSAYNGDRDMDNMSKGIYKKIFRELDSEARETLKSLETALTSPIASNDDW